MKKLYVLALLLVCGLILSSPVKAEEGFSVSSKLPMKVYGFIAAQTMWGDSQVGSFGNNLNMTAPNRVIDETTVGADDAFIGFTMQNTRVGLYLEPYEFDGKSYAIDARLELDFWSTATVSYSVQSPRIRRAYMSLGNDTWNVLFGQEWDLFAPLNPASINVGNVLWNQGNVGFRRPQVRSTYKHGYDKSGVEVAASVNSPNNSMLFNDLGNTTGIPMFQGRLGYWRDWSNGKFQAYVSGMYARHNDAAGGADINNWGSALSLDMPFLKYAKVQAEGFFGYSMNPLLSITAATTKQRTFGGWAAITSPWCDYFETNIGYGGEFVRSADVAAGNLKTNMVGFANMKFKPVTHLMLGVEYNYLRSNYQGNGNSIAHGVLGTAMYVF
ncbi:MAG: hypothetical protein ABII18_09080 [bacterium]|nr:hypothetical protein [bacterium]MBU1917064.1 hypothetical protein [bacterium]